jgi:hypothetical protein
MKALDAAGKEVVSQRRYRNPKLFVVPPCGGTGLGYAPLAEPPHAFPPHGGATNVRKSFRKAIDD